MAPAAPIAPRNVLRETFISFTFLSVFYETRCPHSVTAETEQRVVYHKTVRRF